jgi:hypothetical protein
METVRMSRAFAAAVREQLSVMASATPRRRSRRFWIWTGALVGLGVLAGGGTALASGIWGVPGSPRITTLTAPVHVTETGTATVVLGAAPASTNNVHLDLVCLTAGAFTFPDGASDHCAASDVGTRSAETTYDMAAGPGQTSVTITTSPGASWTLTAGWTTATTTPWGTNSHGQTYGERNSNGTPDLIAVEATNGKIGYVFARQLEDADGDTASRSFTSPAQALAWQKAHPGLNAILRVYKSDGTTKIGVFNVGN